MHDESRNKIITSGVIKTISTIFVSAGKKNKENRYIELAETCMKAMCAFLVNFDKDCAQQIAGEKFETYHALVNFLKTRNKHAIRCVYYLAKIPSCRPLLGNCDAVNITVRLIKEDDDKSLLGELITILCLFCFEANNRVRIRRSLGLETMMDLIKNDNYKNHHMILLCGLVQFLYDVDGLKIMVENGLLDVLTDNMKQMVIDLPENLDDNLISRKRSGDESPCRKTDAKYKRRNAGW